MRTTMRLFFLLTLVATLMSCGKDNTSSSGGSSGITGAITSTSISNLYKNSANFQGFGDPQIFKNYYTNRSFAAGVTPGTVIYHTGEDYGSNYSTFSLQFGFAFCIGFQNLFGNDNLCSNNNGGNDLNDIIDNGEYKILRSATSNSTTYDVATSVSNGAFVYSNTIYDINDPILRRSLNLDDKPTHQVVVSRANAALTGGNQIQADFVEYFFTDGTYEAYVLSPNVPHLANPLVSVSGTYVIGGQVSASIVGELRNIGQRFLSNYSGSVHGIQFNVGLGQYSVYSLGNFSK